MGIKMNTRFLMDGDKLDGAIASKIPDYVVSYGTKRYCNFVGMILQDEDIFFSFPKHFDYQSLTDDEKIEVMNGMLHLFYRGGAGSGTGEQNQFPFDSYQTVVRYMKNYGLYQRQTKVEKFGYSGRVDWNKTIRKSNAVIQKNGIVFMPFVTTRNINYSEFISECMEYVLSYSFESYSKFVDIFYSYSNFPSNPSTLSNVILATTKFDTYWETMIEVFLNGNFNRIDSRTDRIIWGDHSGVTFSKPDKMYIEAESLRKSDYPTGGKKIQFDHFHIDKEKKEIILLDSKYIYNDKFKDLNFKQAFYYYHLKSIYGDEYNIFNGLLAPTSGEYRVEIHVNRKDKTEDMGDETVDGLKIVEHYINMSDVLRYSKDNISKFLSTLAINERSE